MARPMMALYVGGMGARGKNFYNTVAQRYGYEKEAVEIQDLYLDGKKEEAATHVPAEWLELSNLVGPRSYVQERLGAFKEAGVTVLSVNPVGDDPVDTVEQLRELVGGGVNGPARRSLVTRLPRHGPCRAGSRCAPRSEANLAAGREVGAAIAVYHQGRPVVLAGRRFVRRGRLPALHRATPCSWCSRRRRASPRSAVALCVERGLLDDDVPVVDCWPEFGAAGKGGITVAQLLSHQAGLPVIDGPSPSTRSSTGTAWRAGSRRRRRSGSRGRRTATTPSRSAGWPASSCAGSIPRAGRSVGSSPTS